MPVYAVPLTAEPENVVELQVKALTVAEEGVTVSVVVDLQDSRTDILPKTSRARIMAMRIFLFIKVNRR